MPLAPGPNVKFHRGVYLPDFNLWLDPHDDKPFAFVSHAHSDHIGRHREVILTPDTARLMQARLPDERRLEHLLPFRETIEPRPGLRVTLFPAGHILGSAMFLGETEDAGRLLYTGDFKLRAGLSAEIAEPVPADTLIMETTFGQPRFRFPPTDQVLGDMVRFCQETLEDGGTPVLLGYSLGKGQEIIAALHRAGLPAILHGAVHRMTEVVRELRPDFPPAARYQPGTPFPAGHVLICPPSANGTRMVTKLTNPRTAVLTGWALTGPGVLHRYGVDAAFPLSDHADYDDLLRLVEIVQPRRVLTLHGYAAAFARELRARGVEAWALTEENQMDLNLGGEPSGPAPRQRPAADTPETRADIAETRPDTAEIAADNVETRPDTAEIAADIAEMDGDTAEIRADAPEIPADTPDSFAAFVAVGERIASTTGKLKKIAFLAEYFRALDDAALPHAAYFLAGRAFAQNDPRVLNVGGAVIRRALLAVSGVPEARYRELSASLPDQGEITGTLFRDRPAPTGGFVGITLTAAGTLVAALAVARGPTLKGDLLRDALRPLPAAEARYLVKILTGELRIGLKEGLLEEALAVAFDRSADAIREANMLLGDLGRVALLARADRLGEAELTMFQPIKTMLASPEETAEGIWARHEELRAVGTPLQTDGDAGRPPPLDSVDDPLVPPGSARAPRAGFGAPPKSPTAGNRLPPGEGAGQSTRGACAPRTREISEVWVEDKFDGVRAQLHRDADGRVEIYSRDLRRVTGQFDELARAAAAMLPGTEIILDGEIVAYQEGRKLTFFDLQKRLGRKEADLFMRETVPLFFFAFDLLRLSGRVLLTEPLSARRALLETLPVRDPLRVVNVARADSAAAIDAEFDAARRRGNEGLIVKDPASLYTPGRRGLAWLKLKKELATLDVVVVGAEWGHGKRNESLSDYTFAVRDPERDEGDQLVTIGKAYSGLTDEEIAEMTARLLPATLSTKGKFHVVRPEIVLEIAFDSIQPSSRHTSGLAMRFPRIKAIRRDKTPADIDTVDYARSLAG